VGIGGAPQANVGLTIDNSYTGGGGNGIYISPTFTANGITQSFSAIQTSPVFATTNSGYTGLIARNVLINTPTISGTSGLATSYQLYISQGVAATNRYGIYQSGTDPNALSGVLGITNTTTSTAVLTLNGSSSVNPTITVTDAASGGKTWNIGPAANGGATTAYRYYNVSDNTLALSADGTNGITVAGPTNGAAAWKLGTARTSTGLAVSTTTGIQVSVGGTTYTLAVLTTNP
jgi:hypothetical protein